MRTITFYSYKGGVGRTLLVANAARYLSTLGKNVFALDLDLEAPGLHYKFELGKEPSTRITARGVVDLLSEFLANRSFPGALSSYAEKVETPPDTGSIHLMRAGNTPHGDYWTKLARINWYDLFYETKQAPIGVPFFLELKERIAREFKPDFILIDARTGITEMGGVATTLLPDTVVCLSLDSLEHLEGLRAVLRGIQRSLADQQAKRSIEVVAALSRLPMAKDHGLEDDQVAKVRTYLTQPLDGSGTSPILKDLVVLHTEPMLEPKEQLLVGSRVSPRDAPLLRDYLKLFSGIVPAEEIRPHVGQLIERATARLLDDPDIAQGELEALTTYCGDAAAYRALLKLYRLRKAPLEKIVATAETMRDLGVPDSDPLLSEIVGMVFREPRAGDIQKKYAEFGEAIWRANSIANPRIAVILAEAYLPERPDRAAKLLQEYVATADPPHPLAIARLLDLIRGTDQAARSVALAEQFKNVAASASEFQAAWARVVVEQRDSNTAKSLVADPLFRQVAVQSEDPVTLYRLLKLAGSDSAGNVVSEAVADISNSPRSASFRRIRELADAFAEEGRLEELQERLKGRISKETLDDILEGTQRRFGRARFP